jgi:hypothetical protein
MQCLWRDKVVDPKHSLAAWKMVCKPKYKGGLGIFNIQKQNAAVLAKFLDKFYNKCELPWVQLICIAHYDGRIPHAENICGSFWWRDVLKQVDNSKVVATVKLGRGDTFHFWYDNWLLNGSSQPIKSTFPGLFSFVLEENIKAAEVFGLEDLCTLFYRPLSR